jgi:NADH:ubiquinone reductase (H+-translocating)
MTAPSKRARIVVVGGGFGGLQAVRALARVDAEVTLIDRNNYHLFQPLSYQVATGALSPGEIAVPLRRILRRQRNTQVLMGEVTSFDLDRRELEFEPATGTAARTLPYDVLVVAGGSSYAYFGHDEWRSLALEVKSLDSALQVRGRILQAFEASELEDDPDVRAAWLTFVVVGAGPTGFEMAGQIAELARDTLPRELRHAHAHTGRVLLVELAERVLTSFPPSQSEHARRSLDELGIEVLLRRTVVDIQKDGVELRDRSGAGVFVPTRTVVWAAGVEASPLARALAEADGTEVDRSGRVTVESDLTLPGHDEVLALGDMVRVRDAHTSEPRVFPGVAPVAMQQGRYAGRLIAERLQAGHSHSPPRPSPPFRYRDKGTLATIGRARAVADIYGLRLWGFPAWLTWLLVHLFYLVGFENRVLIVLRWTYSFVTRGRGSRLITEAAGVPYEMDAHEERAAASESFQGHA